MIKSVCVRNYALIEKTEIELEPGFTIITGETGAGKSILLGAIGLTLGQRADVSVIKDRSKKCVVEITYEVKGYDLQAWFEENDLDYDDQVVVRREVLPDGKSRAFINDSPVNNKLLKQFGDFLIDVHSQHQSLLLGKPEYQLDILDTFCGNEAVLEEYKTIYDKRQRLLKELEEVKRMAREAEQEEDYLKFQFNQLEEACLREGEQEELEEELSVLNNAEMIKSTFSEVGFVLSGEEQSVIQSLKTVRSRLNTLSEVLKDAADYGKRMNSVVLELEDIADDVERKAENVEFNPSRVEFINERLNVIYELERKHKVETVGELLRLQAGFMESLNNIRSYGSRVESLQDEIGVLENSMNGLAGKIHEARIASEGDLRKEMEELLVGLGIKHAVFAVSITSLQEFTPTGKDDVKFLFSANKNQEPGELVKVASGGEISRLMLSLKYILSRTKLLPVIIFDEIDTGVSGDIAHRMAVMMREMANRMQVLAITHLPQLAAAGNCHFKVYKEDGEESTVSRIRRLNEDERVLEIAGMMSGSVVNEAALENARFLLKQNY